eukprot:CAMPEP_0171229326 /NCGR_PEP_ID=MMETSP0790-20130122/38825_1 /TAXON_ID=2925 /ORGANISM="Alexandrium catenella, Strain OF101" /LENGTH=53 /DNA_ID=CAMNT_0011695507 /DNA_START=5 /DNA_END=163 /DNA_ORIENTATION=+
MATLRIILSVVPAPTVPGALASTRTGQACGTGPRRSVVQDDPVELRLEPLHPV